MEDKSDEKSQSRQSIEEVAERYRDISDTDLLLRKVIDEFNTHAKVVGGPINPNSLVESRFTPPQEAYDRGLSSCGVKVSFAAEILRHLGYRVKLIDGYISKPGDHAWIMIQDPETEAWKQYDLTTRDLQVTDQHHVRFMVNSWEDIRKELENRSYN